MGLRRKLFILALVLATGNAALALLPSPETYIRFDLGSATLDFQQRRQIAEFARLVRDTDTSILLSTEASANDNAKIRSDRMEIVSKLLQAEGIRPGRIQVLFLDYDANRKGLSHENEYAKKRNIPFSGWDLTQMDGIKMQSR